MSDRLPLVRKYFWTGVLMLALCFLLGWASFRPKLYVWANPRSMVYHCGAAPKSAHGSVMTEPEAKRAGYRAANGRECK